MNDSQLEVKTFVTLLALGTSAIAAPALMPLADGTTWKYRMTEEAGEGLGFSGQPAGEARLSAEVAYRLDGKQNVDGKDLSKFEMHRDGMITNTDLMQVDEHGMICCARIDEAGTLTKLDPPQPMISLPLKEGTRWDYDAKIGGAKVHQHYAVIGKEEVAVPARKFTAYKILGEQTEPQSMVIERWVVDGVGIVKDVTTTRNADGNLLRRITLELEELPKVAPKPEARLNRLSATVGSDETGPETTHFDAKTEKICARWRGSGLSAGANIRAIWIAEKVEGIAPPDYKIDEANTTATGASSRGVFTLGRPEGGWTAGDYRVELYVGDELVKSIKLKIDNG